MNETLGKGYPVNESGGRRYAVKEPPERRYPVKDFPDVDSGPTNGMMQAEAGYDITTLSGNDSFTFLDADDALVSDVGVLTIWQRGEILAIFAPGKWDYVLDRRACFGSEPATNSGGAR